MKKIKKKRLLRPVIQIGFFVIVATIALAKTLTEKGIKIPFIKEVSLHAICP